MSLKGLNYILQRSLYIYYYKLFLFFKISQWITSRTKHGSTLPYDKFTDRNNLKYAIIFFSWIFQLAYCCFVLPLQSYYAILLFVSYIFNSGVINDTLFETLNYNECMFNDHSRYVEVEPCQNFKVKVLFLVPHQQK